MSHRGMFRRKVSAQTYILDELSITPLDVLAFKKLTANAGKYCVRVTVGGTLYDVAWDSNNELSSSSPTYTTGGTPTGNTLGDLGYALGGGLELVRWYEQSSGGTNYIEAIPSYPRLVDNSGNGDYANFYDISFNGNSINVYPMNNASSAGALPVSFYGYNKPLDDNNNLYYFGNNGLNPQIYQRYLSGLHYMRNGGAPFMNLSGVRNTWAHELANFTSSGTGQTYYVDNVLDTTGTSNNTTQFTQLRIGQGCLFRFAISFDGNLVDPDRTTLYDYMHLYY